jgi:hypothetical protein
VGPFFPGWRARYPEIAPDVDFPARWQYNFLLAHAKLLK